MSFQKSKVLLISFAHFAHDIFSALLPPILPLLIEKLGISLTQAALLDIARKIPSLFNPIFGIIAQRVEAKYFVIFAPSITAISMGLLSITSSFAIALFLLFIAGISVAFFHIPSPTMIKEFSGSQSGKGMSYFMTAGESARTIGPLLAAGVISIWGLEGIWKLTPIGIITSLFLYIKLKNYKSTYSAKNFQIKDIKKILKSTFPFFSILTIYILLNFTSKFSVSIFLPVYLTQVGYSVEKASIAFALLQGFGILGAFFAGRISDKIGRKKMLIISSVGAAVSLLCFLYFKNLMWLTLAPLGFFLFSQSPVLLAFVHDIKTDAPTFINSLYMTINFGISSIIVLLAGFLGEKVGLFNTYLIAAFLTILSSLVVFKIKIKTQ